MKKRFVILLLILTPVFIFAQSKQLYYLELVEEMQADGSYGGYYSCVIAVIGEGRDVYCNSVNGDLNKKYRLKIEGDVYATSLVSAANYLSSLGWRVVSTHINTYTGLTHWIMSKEAESEEEAYKGIERGGSDSSRSYDYYEEEVVEPVPVESIIVD